jgi:hypothetical protein
MPSSGLGDSPPYGWLAGRYARTARTSHVALLSFSACRAPYPGGTAWVHWSVASPRRDGLPLSSRGVGFHVCTIEACSGFTCVAARRFARITYVILCPRSSARAIARTVVQVATQPYRQLLGWISHPRDNSAFVAHRGIPNPTPEWGKKNGILRAPATRENDKQRILQDRNGHYNMQDLIINRDGMRTCQALNVLPRITETEATVRDLGHVQTLHPIYSVQH